jgi:DNA replication protein DnaC
MFPIPSSSLGSYALSGTRIKNTLWSGASATPKRPERWSLDTFPFAGQLGVNRKQIRTFAELDFVPQKENIVFIGPTGVGKSGLASGILLKAIENGYRCQFIRAQDLFDEMYASLADRSTRQLLNASPASTSSWLTSSGTSISNRSSPTSSSN